MPITIPGGVNSDLARAGYQDDTDLLVNTDPNNPANWQIDMLTNSRTASRDTKLLSLNGPIFPP
ncbi:MAG TPA: hypothetical protein PK918_06270 [Methanotrichaceae archaeon]|nr:hypothetical protein [Methanotrichaceae archaeon]